jgi:protein O-GlcNAc transferase
VVGHNILPLFENRDREKFQIFCYSNTPRPDGLTARFRSLSAGWLDIGPLSDDRAAELIVSEKIDILVDLALHTTGNRLGVLARKPAPVQVTFAGYPGTTGLPSIDYRLTDPYLDPPGGHDGFYTEQSVRLPHSFWCHRPIPHDAPVNPLPALQSGTITFGYLGAFSKINPPTLDLWSRVLAAVPASKLLLMSRPGSSRARTLEHFAARGIDSSRVEFADHQPRE